MANDIGGGNAVIVAGPYKRTVQSNARVVAGTIVQYLSTYIPNNRRSFVVNGIGDILTSMGPSTLFYSKTYYVRTYSSYYEMYIFKVMVEKHTTSAYNNPVSTMYYEVGRSTTTKLPGVN